MTPARFAVPLVAVLLASTAGPVVALGTPDLGVVIRGPPNDQRMVYFNLTGAVLPPHNATPLFMTLQIQGPATVAGQYADQPTAWSGDDFNVFLQTSYTDASNVTRTLDANLTASIAASYASYEEKGGFGFLWNLTARGPSGKMSLQGNASRSDSGSQEDPFDLFGTTSYWAVGWGTMRVKAPDGTVVSDKLAGAGNCDVDET
jgi:hypothetical protein